MYDEGSIGNGETLPAIAHIRGPVKKNLERVDEIVRLYREGKIDALAIATGSEDGSMDAMFVDVSPNCHATRSIFACLHLMARHVMQYLA